MIADFFKRWRADWAEMNSLEKNLHYAVAVLFLFGMYMIVDDFAYKLDRVKENEAAKLRDVTLVYLIKGQRPGVEHDILQAWFDCAQGKPVPDRSGTNSGYIRRSSETEIVECHNTIRVLFARNGIEKERIDSVVKFARRNAP